MDRASVALQHCLSGCILSEPRDLKSLSSSGSLKNCGLHYSGHLRLAEAFVALSDVHPRLTEGPLPTNPYISHGERGLSLVHAIMVPPVDSTS